MYVSQLEKEEEIEPLYKDEESIEIKIEKMIFISLIQCRKLDDEKSWEKNQWY